MDMDSEYILALEVNEITSLFDRLIFRLMRLH